MGILHLVDIDPLTSGPCLHHLVGECLQVLPGHEHVVMEVGAGPRMQGDLPCSQGRIPGNESHLSRGRHPVSGVLDTWEKRWGSPCLVHAWGPASVELATRWAGGYPCLGTLDAFDCSSSFIDLLRAEPAMHMVCTSRGALNRAMASGLPESSCSELVPCLSRDQAPDAGRLRERWEAGDDTIVFAAMGEPASWTNLKELANVAGRFGLLGHDVRLLADPSFDRFEEALHWMELVGLQDVIRIEPAVSRPWQLQGAIDAVLLDGHASHRTRVAGSCHLHWALDNHVPVLLGNGHPAVTEVNDRGGAWFELDAFLHELPVLLREASVPADNASSRGGDPASWAAVNNQYERMASGEPANSTAAPR
ncbi:MAG: hypothetical protein VX908_08380 [Planctomycetota bacterium]|nr:hypothetical protein [Planctomycetota bacterium]